MSHHGSGNDGGGRGGPPGSQGGHGHGGSGGGYNQGGCGDSGRGNDGGHGGHVRDDHGGGYGSSGHGNDGGPHGRSGGGPGGHGPGGGDPGHGGPGYGGSGHGGSGYGGSGHGGSGGGGSGHGGSGGDGHGGGGGHGGHGTDAYIVRGTTSGCYPRLDIEVLQKDQYQWSLFMQAMRNIQQKGYKPKPASWQEIGGIHGIPYTRWSGDPNGPSQPQEGVRPGEGGKTQEQWQGYCFHSSVLFPTWHRVYMLLIEQSLSEEAKEIVDDICRGSISHSEQEYWRTAATQLRLPFWDWSSHEAETKGLPMLFIEPTTTVYGPGGRSIRLDPNPLSMFIFNEIPANPPNPTDPSIHVSFATWKRTYRWAKVPPGQSIQNEDVITEDYEMLNKALKHGLADGEGPALGPPFIPISAMRDKLRRMFSYPAEADQKMWATYYDYFAGTAPQAANNAPPDVQQSLKALIALEDPHNSIHLDIGGNGTMGFDETAGFDPIFFFHHCNVDRHQALWEYCYPDYWLGKGYYDYNTGSGPKPFIDRDGTYQTGTGKPFITEDTGLPPFRKSDNEYWNSTDVRGPKAILRTYTYPPMEINVRGHKVVIDISKPATVTQRKVYIAALQVYFSDLSTPLPEKASPAIGLPPIFNSPLARGKIPEHLASPLPGYRDFFVAISLPQHAFKGSHRLKLYVDDQMVNELSVFSRIVPEQCGNCAGRIASGTDFVRGALGIPHSAIMYILQKECCNGRDTSDEKVIAAIVKHLTAKVVTPSGQVLAMHVASSAATGGGPAMRRVALKAELWPKLELISSRMAISKRTTDTLEPDTPFDWRHHGAVLNQNWCQA